MEDTREVEEPKSEPEEAEPVEAVAKTEEATPVVAQAEESKSSSSEAAGEPMCLCNCIDALLQAF